MTHKKSPYVIFRTFALVKSFAFEVWHKKKKKGRKNTLMDDL